MIRITRVGQYCDLSKGYKNGEGGRGWVTVEHNRRHLRRPDLTMISRLLSQFPDRTLLCSFPFIH